MIEVRTESNVTIKLPLDRAIELRDSLELMRSNNYYNAGISEAAKYVMNDIAVALRAELGD